MTLLPKPHQFQRCNNAIVHGLNKITDFANYYAITSGVHTFENE